MIRLYTIEKEFYFTLDGNELPPTDVDPDTIVSLSRIWDVKDVTIINDEAKVFNRKFSLIKNVSLRDLQGMEHREGKHYNARQMNRVGSEL